MIFIVAHHIGVHGAYAENLTPFNSFVKILFSSGGKLGVNIFVLISGYFLVKSTFKWRRILNTVCISAFYGVMIYLALLLFSPGMSFAVGDLSRSIFVIRGNLYWFVTCYVAMLLFSPFINRLLSAISEREHLILIALLLFMQMIVPGITSYIPLSETAWFITLYIIAAYIRLYPKKLFENKLVTGIACIIFCTVLAVWKYSTAMTNLFCLLPSLSLFCFFNCLDVKHNRFINLISRTTFAVYLLHDNPFIRPRVWNVWLCNRMHSGLDGFILFAALAVVIVFVVCSLIELLRILLMKPLMPVIDRFVEKIGNEIKSLSSHFKRK